MDPRDADAGWRPIAAPQRAAALDAVRGLAILGVLVANTLTFAYPQVARPPDLEAMRGSGVADRTALLLVGLLVEGKFYTLLSVLFGMGLALQAERARAAGRAFSTFYVRRSAVLLAIGLLHGALLYSGDVLAFYAIVAVAALPFRHLSARALAWTAGLCGALALAGLTAYASAHPSHPFPQPPDWRRLAEQEDIPVPGEASLAAARDDAGFIVRGAASVLDTIGLPPRAFFRLMDDEVRVYREGTWAEVTRHRAIVAWLFALPSKLAFLGCFVLACFLLGMSLARRGAIPDTREPDLRRWRLLCVAGVPLGLGLVVFASGMQLLVPQPTLAATIYWAGTLGGTLLQGLGYAGGLVLVCARRPDSPAVRALVAVGRTALSNYLLQSILLGFLFYGTGLGLFTRLTALPVVAMAVPVFALLAWLSDVWLRRFTMGPAEWAWRCLTYGRLLPLRRG